jgi:hypothetical protein
MSQTATRVYLGKKDAFPGWWVVGGCFTVLFFSSALGFYGMSVYLNAFSKELGWKISSLSIATTFFFLVGGITNMLVARLIAKFDVRILIYIGAVVGAGSLYMLGHVSQKWHLFVVYGVFAVAWSCSGLTTATTVVTRWFHTKRAPGIAAASSGLSMGGVVLTPIIKKLIDAKQMSGASPYLALIWFVGMCVPAYLLIRPDPLALNWMPDGQPKPENTCPFCYGKLITNRKSAMRGYTVFKRKDKPNSVTYHKYIRFLDDTTQPDGLSLPCCFIKPKTLRISNPEFSHIRDYLQEVELREQLNQEELDEIDDTEPLPLRAGEPVEYAVLFELIHKKYILESKPEAGQFAIVPSQFDIFFRQNSSESIITRVAVQLKLRPNANGFIRIGTEYSINESLLAVIAPLIYRNTINEVKSRILEVVTPRVFINYHFGNLV